MLQYGYDERTEILKKEVDPMTPKIQMKTPLVEMDGDEMTRILWKMIKDILILPYIDLKSEYYDLGMKHRDDTDDEVTIESALATKKYGVAVKCATITANAARVKEYDLKKMWPSPNGTIRAILDGTVFRKPIMVKGIAPLVRNWEKPITIARHAFGDIYKNTELRIPAGGKAELVVTDAQGRQTRRTIHEFKGEGITQGIFNTDESIRSYAHACFDYALSVKEDLWFATKDTVSKIYDHRFKDIFQEIYDKEYKTRYEACGIEYFYTLIDDVVARIIRSRGGMVWACKNYDGDVMSDLIAAASGSLPMMTSVLVSPDGNFEYEAAHGTVTDHFYRWRRGEKVSTNPLATMAAWAGALRKRGEWDKNQRLVDYSDCLKQAGLDVFEEGYLSEDLAALCDPADLKEMPDNDRLLSLIRQRLEVLLAQ